MNKLNSAAIPAGFLPPTQTPALYGQDGQGLDAIVHAHYFVGSCDWFLTEYDPETSRAFGWACLGAPRDAELGYFALAELHGIQVPPLGLRIERDQDWQPCPLTLAIAGLAWEMV